MDNSKVWFIADTHFDHLNIIKYCDRPFTNTEEMNQCLINNWNKVVKKNDRVFMLGDFALCGKNKIIEIGKQLNGRKTLILGNHDGGSLQTYYNAGFEMVSKYPIVFNDYILSHYPVDCSSTLFKNIYGHVHNSEQYRDVTLNDICVSVERINYTPISLEEIEKKFKEVWLKIIESYLINGTLELPRHKQEKF